MDEEDLEIGYDDYDLEAEQIEKKKQSLRSRGIKKVLVNRISDNRLHYAV